MTPQHARPLREWHEDHGSVLWWTFPIEEAPWCGRPDCSDWPGYHRWWTPLSPAPLPPAHLTPRIQRMDASRARRLMEGYLLDLEYLPDNATWTRP